MKNQTLTKEIFVQNLVMNDDYVKEQITDKLGVPKKLHRFGIHKDDYNKLNKIMKTQQAAFDQNPIKFTVKKDFKKMIKNFL